jgi:hypothetical protein
MERSFWSLSLVDLERYKRFMKMKTYICCFVLALSCSGCGASSQRVGEKIIFLYPIREGRLKDLGYYSNWQFLVANITEVSGENSKFTDQYGETGEIQIKNVTGSKLTYTPLKVGQDWSGGDAPEAYLITNPAQKPQANDVLVGTNNVLERRSAHKFWPFFVSRMENGKPSFDFRDVDTSAWLSKEDWNRMGGRISNSEIMSCRRRN